MEANILRRIEPYISYASDRANWRRADPETGTFPQEEPTDNLRGFVWSTFGRNIRITTVVGGKVMPPRDIPNCPGDLSNTQVGRTTWQDVYIDEILS